MFFFLGKLVKDVEPSKDDTPVKKGRGRTARHKSPKKESENISTESEKAQEHVEQPKEEQPKKRGRGRQPVGEKTESQTVEVTTEKIEKKARGKNKSRIFKNL